MLGGGDPKVVDRIRLGDVRLSTSLLDYELMMLEKDIGEKRVNELVDRINDFLKRNVVSFEDIYDAQAFVEECQRKDEEFCYHLIKMTPQIHQDFVEEITDLKNEIEEYENKDEDYDIQYERGKREGIEEGKIEMKKEMEREIERLLEEKFKEGVAIGFELPN